MSYWTLWFTLNQLPSVYHLKNVHTTSTPHSVNSYLVVSWWCLGFVKVRRKELYLRIGNCGFGDGWTNQSRPHRFTHIYCRMRMSGCSCGGEGYLDLGEAHFLCAPAVCLLFSAQTPGMTRLWQVSHRTKINYKDI